VYRGLIPLAGSLEFWRLSAWAAAAYRPQISYVFTTEPCTYIHYTVSAYFPCTRASLPGLREHELLITSPPPPPPLRAKVKAYERGCGGAGVNCCMYEAAASAFFRGAVLWLERVRAQWLAKEWMKVRAT
jgi:hypothetical protein